MIGGDVSGNLPPASSPIALAMWRIAWAFFIFLLASGNAFRIAVTVLAIYRESRQSPM
jgi:hypothetical protein